MILDKLEAFCMHVALWSKKTHLRQTPLNNTVRLMKQK